MWRTQIGNRTLKGAEAELVRESLGFMCDMLIDEFQENIEQWEYEVGVFDQLACGQRIVVLANVATYLLTDTEDFPSLNAINEGAVGAIYENIRGNIQFELDDLKSSSGSLESEQSTWRSLVLSACKQSGVEELPDINNLDYFEWDINLEVLEDLVLWDRDFENGDIYFDIDPDQRSSTKNMMGIADDYFTVIAPDPTIEGVERAMKRLLELTR